MKMSKCGRTMEAVGAPSLKMLQTWPSPEQPAACWLELDWRVSRSPCQPQQHCDCVKKETLDYILSWDRCIFSTAELSEGEHTRFDTVLALVVARPAATSRVIGGASKKTDWQTALLCLAELSWDSQGFRAAWQFTVSRAFMSRWELIFNLLPFALAADNSVLCDFQRGALLAQAVYSAFI